MEKMNIIIENYAIDIQDDLDVSPFEYVDTLRVRDYLEENKNALNSIQKEKLKKLDSILLSRANDFYEYLKPTKVWGNEKMPIENWWWHLDKVANGTIKVNIEEDLKNNLLQNNQEKEQGTKKDSPNKPTKRRFKPIKESHKYIKRRKLRRK